MDLGEQDFRTPPDLEKPDLPPSPSGIGAPCTSGTPLDQGSCADAKCATLDATGNRYCVARCAGDDVCRGPVYACSMTAGECLPTAYYFIEDTPPGTDNGAACARPTHAPGDGALDGPFGKSTQLPGTMAWQGPGWLAFDPASGRLAVAVDDAVADFSSRVVAVARSGDDGATWQAAPAGPAPNSATSFAAAATAAFDGGGDLFVSWLGWDRINGVYGNAAAWAARSGDGGASFPDAARVSVPGESPNDAGVDVPSMAVSPLDGTVAVVWARVNQQDVDEIRLSRSVDHGKTWSAAATVNTARADLFREVPRAAFGADGALYVAWVEWKMPAYDPLARFGDVASAVWLQRFAPDGTPVGGNVRTTAPPDAPGEGWPSLAVSGQNVYVAFASGSAKGDWDVRVAASADGGASFAPSVKVNDDASCATHFRPTIAVDDQGDVHAMWLDNRFLAGNVLYARSAPATAQAPLAFGKNRFVNDVPFTFTTHRDQASRLGLYLGLTVGNGEIYAAWADNRGGSLAHVYFAKAPLK